MDDIGIPITLDMRTGVTYRALAIPEVFFLVRNRKISKRNISSRNIY